MMRCIPLIKCFSFHAISISRLAPILCCFEAALHCKSISFWRDSVLWIAWTAYAQLLWLQCCCRARLLCLPGNSTGKSIVFGKKNEIFFGKKIELLKLLILNVSMSFVFFWTIFGLILLRLASLGWFLCWFFFLLLLPPFLVVVRPYHFSLLVQKDVNSVAGWAWPGTNTLPETC